MKTAIAIASMAALLAGCAESPARNDGRLNQAWGAIQNWSSDSKAAAADLIEKYGPPDHLDAGRLVWFHNGPWKRIEVWDLAASKDILEETVAYNVEPDKKGALAAFSDRLSVSQDGSELSVRSPSEAENFLTINLAAEILKGYTAPNEARENYARIMELRASGKSSSFTEGLRFPAQP